MISQKMYFDLHTMLSILQFVYYFEGGKRSSRPILTGAVAKPTFSSIPVIDISPMFSSSLKERQQLASQVGKACRGVGFFYAQNHNVPEALISRTFKAVEDFFRLPLEEKMQCHIHKSPALRGYEPLFETRLDPNSKGGRFPHYF